MNRLLLTALVAGTLAAPMSLAQDTAREGQAPPAHMQKMMQAHMQAGTPGEMHAHLARSVGTWDGQVRMWFMPGMDPQESTCTTTITSIFGGRFIKSEVVGDMGPMGRFEGFGLYGYNNTTEQFESVWISNMGTHITTGVGELSSDRKMRTWRAEYVCPATHEPRRTREVERFIDDDTMTLQVHGPGPDGEEYKMMEIRYTRRADEPPAEDAAAM